MKPTQEELATKLYDALFNYEDAFNVMDSKVRDVFNRQVGTVAGLEKRIEELQKIAQSQKELIDRIQKQVMWGDALQTSWKIRTWIEEFQKEGETQ